MISVTFRPCPSCGLELTFVDYGRGHTAWMDSACLTLFDCPHCEAKLPRREECCRA